ncbi:MAG: NAD-dependent epimerase/dehydratase family protein [Bacteroidales bacterium]|nr:NAD-dependent epimerase/dehydratase family protein [Bacteroidales bacterium]
MILVTGATGFLGSHLLYELTRSGREVRALYRDEQKIAFTQKVFGYYQAEGIIHSGKIDWVKGDVTDPVSLLSVLNNVELVYHVAGRVSFLDSDRGMLNLTNAVGTANMVNACLQMGVRKLCHVSSIATLGESAGSQSVNEEVLWNEGETASAYAYSKYIGEMEVWRGIHEGLDAVIVNPAVIIGPGMWQGETGDLFKKIYTGLSYYPAGASGYVDVRDVARIMIQLTDDAITGERFILCSENMTHRQYLNQLADAFGSKRPDRVISPNLASMAVFLESLRSFFFRKARRISKRTMQIARENLSYSNDKVREKLGITFIPVDESIRFLAGHYLREMNLPSGHN